jgi:phosphomannomutase
MTAHSLDATILREYDIRGIVGETLSAADAAAIGRAFATVINEAGGRKVFVGRDGRLSSPELEAALVDGLVSQGMEVVRIGLGPTPMLYFAVHTRGGDGGVMVSGSHNPPNYNGFKMMAGDKPFFGADIQRLGDIAAAGNFTLRQGSCGDEEVFDDYVARLAEDYDDDGRLGGAWDAGNADGGREPGPASNLRRG